MIKEKTTELSLKIRYDYNSFVSALVICLSLINGAIGISNISYITISLIGVLFIISLLTKRAHLITKDLWIPAYVLFLFLISSIFNDNHYLHKYLLFFLGFGLLSFFTGLQSINWRLLSYYLELIGLVCLTVFFIRGYSDINASLQMGFCYSLLPVFFSSVLSLIKRRTILLSLPVFLLSAFVYLSIAPRGIWVAIFVFGLFISFYYFTKGASPKKTRIKSLIFSVSILTISVWLGNNLFVILKRLNNYAINKTGNSIYAINKLLFLFENNNLDNGRSSLSENAIEMIKSSPFFGKGIGAFESQNNGLYVHNIVLQSLCECGIFGLIPIVLLFVISIYLIVSSSKFPLVNYELLFLLFVNGVLILLYSSVYWQQYVFWYYIGFLLQNVKGRVIINEIRH